MQRNEIEVSKCDALDQARRGSFVRPAGRRHKAELEEEQGQMIPTAGERFGPYEILGTLGRGGVGEVYRAWDGRLEREVAIKLLHDDYPQPSARERFLIEARVASALSHPNICTIFDMGEKDGAPYLVMELLKGETLKHRIERGGIAAEQIAEFGIEIVDALGAAHAVGIVHRDVKPANIMLIRQPDGRVRIKVLDFGLAKIKGTLPSGITHDEHLTVPGEAVGTVAYMSPEQARGKELDGRSDLFSLGTVMYEMATRRTPFQGSTTPLLFVQLLNEHPESIRNWNEEVPKALEKVIFRLLEKEPGRRFQDAQDVIAALTPLLGKTSGARKRRLIAPPVPLVRVEEPVARAGLPMRPEGRREAAVFGSGSDELHASPGSGGRDHTPAVVVRRVAAEWDGGLRPIRLGPTSDDAVAEQEARVVKIGQRESSGAEERSSAVAVQPLAIMRAVEPSAAMAPEIASSTTLAPVEEPAIVLPDVVALPIFVPEPIAYAPVPEPVEQNPEPISPVEELVEAPVAVVTTIDDTVWSGGVQDEEIGRTHSDTPHEEPVQTEVVAQWVPTPVMISEEIHPTTVMPVAALPVWEEAVAEAHFETSDSHETAVTDESDAPVPVAANVWEFPQPAFAAPAPVTEPVRVPLRFESEAVVPVDDVWLDTDDVETGGRTRRSRWAMWGAAAAALTIATAFGIAHYGKGAKGGLLAPGQRVAVAGIENHTGAQMLDGSAAVALEFALAEDTRVPLVDEASYAQSLRGLSPDGRPVDVVTARQAALAAGADAYLYGEVAQSEDAVHGSGATYRLTVVLRDAHSDRELTRAVATADRIEDVPGAVDKVAEALLTAMYSRPSGDYLPVAREASASLGALHLYAAGLQAETEGRDAAAVKAYSSAASNDPGFVQALLRISWLARAENAMGASADAAQRASAAAEGRSRRTLLLAKVAEQANGNGDLDGAISSAKELLQTNAKDESATLLLARALRIAGNYPEASKTAQQGIADNPRNGAMYAESELALIGLDRAPEAAAQMESAAGLGISRPAFRDMVDYLAGKAQATEAGSSTAAPGANEPGVLAVRGVFLDNTGDLSDAEESWARAADSVRGQAGLSGAANSLLARAALNRALAGDCNRALTLASSAAVAQAKDTGAALRAGVAAGLCADDELAQTAESVLSSAGDSGGAAEVRTALAVAHGDAALAEQNAKSIGHDPIYLGTYLSSLAHIEADQPSEAVAELEEVLAHRGAVSIAGTNLYPVAQLALARAFAGTSDRTNSMQAYSRFMGLWDGAGSKDGLRVEAAQGTRGVLPERREILARLEPEGPRPQIEEATARPEDRAYVRPAVMQPRPPKAPLLTGLPESWFQHPAPGQGTGVPVGGAPAGGSGRANNLE